MKKLIFLIFVTATSSAFAQEDREKLEESPRHQEWVEITYNDRTVYAFVVYPEISEKAKTVIVIHENRGLNDWARVFADELAAKGFIAVAPDLLSQTDGHEKTSDFENSDKARESIYTLSPEQVMADLNATFEYAYSLPAGNNEVSVVGFCWGGSQSFRYAAENSKLEEAVVFYGTAPKDWETLEKIEVPVYAFYGGNDERVNATIEETERFMKAADNFYDYKIYDGAGHGYMRSGSYKDAEEENIIARKESWERLIEILRN